MRRPCAVTRSSAGPLLSESGMSHETSLHTSRTVLTASIAICGCLALVSFVRLFADRRNSTESTHGSTRNAEVGHDRKRTYGESHPRSETRVSSTTSKGPHSFRPTQQVASTKKAQRPIQALSQLYAVPVSRPESQRSSVRPHDTATASPPVSVPIIVNVNNGELLEELVRVDEKLDALSGHSVRDSNALSATPEISEPAVATIETVSPEVLTQLEVPESHSIVVPNLSAINVETEEPTANVDDQWVSMTPNAARSMETAEPEAMSPFDAVVSDGLPLPKPSVVSPELMALPELISEESSLSETRNQAPILEETEIVLFAESIEQPNAVADSLSTLTEPEPSAPDATFSEPALPEPLLPGPDVPETVLTGPTSAMPLSMDSDVSASVAASDFMTDDKFTFPATSGGTVNEHAANAVSATLTQERSNVPAVPPAIDSAWSDHTLTQSSASSAFAESSATSDRRSVENQKSAGRASSGTANHSHRTVSPLTQMRERMAGFLKAPSRPGFERPDWMDDLGDWRERQSDAISSAARSLTSPSKTLPRNPDAHRERQLAQHAMGKQGLTDSRPRQENAQPENPRQTFAASFRSVDSPEWFGSVRNAAAEQSAKSSQVLHRATSVVRFAARPKTVE